jgi:hypothetical protein
VGLEHSIHEPGILAIAGFIVGLCTGLTGMGGGVLMTPLLVLGLGLPPGTAVGTDLAYASLTKLAGAWQHWRQGTVDMRIVRDLALGSLPGSLLAVAAMHWLSRYDAVALDIWLRRAIGITLLLAVLLMAQQLVERRSRMGESQPSHSLPVTAIGALGGFLVSLTSVGSGSIMLALLSLVMPLTAERLVGTDVAHAALLTAVAALAHWHLGQVNMAVVGQLLLGSIPGVLLGSRLAVRLPRRALQAGLAGLLAVSSITLLK